MKRSLVIVIASIISWAMSAPAMAQTVLVRTNEVGMTTQDHTLTMNQGSMRLNIRVTEAGVNKNMSDITTFRATAKDLTDGRIVQAVTQDTTGTEIDASQGQVRFVFSTLTDRGIDPDYEIEAYAVASDTNQNYRIHWGYLSVTSAPAASSSIYVSNYIPITVTANVAGVSVIATVLVDNVYSPSNSYYVTVNYTNLTEQTIIITNQLDNITETINNTYTTGVSSVNSATGAVTIVGGDNVSVTTTGPVINIASEIGYTNLAGSGSGAVITNIIEADGGIQYQLGSVAGGGGATGWVHVLSYTVTSTVASVELSGWSQNSSMLVLRWSAETDHTATAAMFCRLNGDASANAYTYSAFYGIGSVFGLSSSGGETRLGNVVTNQYGSGGIAYFLDYTATNYFQRGHGEATYSTSPTQLNQWQAAWHWKNPAPVTNISLFSSTSNIVAGSTFDVWEVSR